MDWSMFSKSILPKWRQALTIWARAEGFAMLGRVKSKTVQRRTEVELDRKHVEERARRFLRGYLESSEMGKAAFYRAVQDISDMCQQANLDSGSIADDASVAEAISQAAMKMVLDRTGRIRQDDSVAGFVTDACATVAIAYHRAAGVYQDDNDLQQLGTAAVHLLTMARSYKNAHEED
jgi:hypothetical protein